MVVLHRSVPSFDTAKLAGHAPHTRVLLLDALAKATAASLMVTAELRSRVNGSNFPRTTLCRLASDSVHMIQQIDHIPATPPSLLTTALQHTYGQPHHPSCLTGRGLGRTPHKGSIHLRLCSVASTPCLLPIQARPLPLLTTPTQVGLRAAWARPTGPSAHRTGRASGPDEQHTTATATEQHETRSMTVTARRGREHEEVTVESRTSRIMTEGHGPAWGCCMARQVHRGMYL